MSVELLDDLEAGELSVEFEGEEPDVLLEWAIDRFSPSIAISTAFQSEAAAALAAEPLRNVTPKKLSRCLIL